MQSGCHRIALFKNGAQFTLLCAIFGREFRLDYGAFVYHAGWLLTWQLPLSLMQEVYLFYGHRFCQVAGLVDVCPFDQCNVVTEQLQGQGVEHRRDAFFHPGQAYRLYAAVAAGLDGFAGEVDQLAAAGADLFQVGAQFFQQAVAGCDADHGHVFIY